jgi:ribosomal protein S18 acetylase RimI-like enzyme
MSTTTAPAPQTAAVDRDRALTTMVLAFSSDPVIRWLFPASDAYLRSFPQLVGLLGRAGFTAGTVDRVHDHAGVAAWVPPGSPRPDDEATELLVDAVPPSRLPEIGAFLDQVAEYHPETAHWYLPFIGVDPTRQGLGLGSTLLTHGLARCDEDGLPAYLEASSPRNRDLYARHGFEVAAEIRVDGSPPLWPMLRPASPLARRTVADR